MGNEVRTPQTKEFAVSSIHDETLSASIKKLMQGLGSGLLETNLDDEYLHVALFSDSFARFIDIKTYYQLEPEIRDHLNRDADTASFVIVDSSEPLPIQHPRLHRLQDVSLEWIANEIAKGREWDAQECERYYREVREKDE